MSQIHKDLIQKLEHLKRENAILTEEHHQIIDRNFQCKKDKLDQMIALKVNGRQELESLQEQNKNLKLLIEQRDKKQKLLEDEIREWSARVGRGEVSEEKRILIEEILQELDK